MVMMSRDSMMMMPAGTWKTSSSLGGPSQPHLPTGPPSQLGAQSRRVRELSWVACQSPRKHSGQGKWPELSSPERGQVRGKTVGPDETVQEHSGAQNGPRLGQIRSMHPNSHADTLALPLAITHSQWLEHKLSIQKIPGSNPSTATSRFSGGRTDLGGGLPRFRHKGL